MKITIALATYNGSKHLQEQLNSFITQTHLPDELVVTDDCSSDDTCKILESFASCAPFKVILHRNEKNYGYCGNFNQSLLRSTGDLVFLSDQDDVWFPEKIQKILALAKEDSHNLVYINDALLTNENLQETGLTKLGQIKSAGLKDSSFVMGCCVAVKRELLDFCLPIPSLYPAHDHWIVEIAEGLGRKRIISQVLQYYRRHDRNESQWIVNRTTRITRWDAQINLIQKGIKKLFTPRDQIEKRSPMDSISKELMRQWATKFKQEVSTRYKVELEAFHSYLEKVTAIQIQREKIRQQYFLKRLYQSIQLWQNGGYIYFPENMKAFFQDIVGT